MAAVVLVDSGGANIGSVKFALARLGVEADITADEQAIRGADKVIMPGVGAAGAGMERLKAHRLTSVLPSLTQPVLGICLGMQLLCAHSEEGDTTCLGIIPQEVRKFIPVKGEKVPHMGWNTLELNGNDWLSPELQGQHVYFVHSYYVEEGPYTVARTQYIHPFTSVLRKDNFFATQFHPEKSGDVGEQILRDFLAAQ